MDARRILSLVLAIALIVGICPSQAFAAGEQSSAAETVNTYSVLVPDVLTTVEISTAGDYAYFRFTPEYTESYTFYSIANGDTYGYLYDNDMEQLASNDDYGGSRNFSITYTLEAGQTYVYAARFYSSSVTGSFDVILKANHVGEGNIITPATCTEDGVMGYICSICGTHYTGVIPAAHTWDEGQITQAPTCTEDGILLYTCTACAETYTESIDGAHSFADGVCTVCGIDRRMYADGDYTAEITSGGAEAYFWFTPEYTDSYTLFAPDYISGNYLGHIRLYDSDMNCFASDHNQDGNGLSLTCKLEAGKTYIWGVGFFHSNTTGTVSATLQTNHRPGSSTVITPATCSEEGLMSCVCEVCNRVYTEVIPATHNPQNGVCVDCGHVMVILGSGSCGENVSWILDETGTLTISGTGAMTDYESGSDVPWKSLRDDIISIVVENGVTSVGENAFYYCTQMTHAFIGDDVTTIGDAAFCSCVKLVDLVIGRNVETIGASAFSTCVMLYDVQLPDSLQRLSSYAFVSCSSIEQIVLPDSLLYISSNAFCDCGELKNITIPNSVKSIGEAAFSDCTRLESITLPDSITNLGELIFSGCSSLTSVVLPSSVRYIPSGMFWYCTSLVDITIPDSITQINQMAFSDCTALEEIAIPGSVTYIGYEAFRGCSSLKSITIPENITNISDYAFAHCTTLAEIVFAGDAPIIGANSLYLVTATCYYPISSESWTDDVWQNYGGSITWIPDGIVASGSCGENICWFFDESGVLTIRGNGAMENYSLDTPAPWSSYADSITSVAIGSGITSVGAHAFSDCSNLASIVFQGDAPSINENAFSALTATAYYPGDNTTWTEDVMQCYGGMITWLPSGTSYCITEQDTVYTMILVDGERGTVSFTADTDSAYTFTVESSDDPWYYLNWSGGYDLDYVDDGLRVYLNAGDTFVFYIYPDLDYGTYSITVTTCASGSCGDNATWIFDEENGTLTISGTGDMDNYTASNAPWTSINHEIATVKIEGEITSISDYAFFSSALTSVTIPDSVASVGAYAFSDCSNLTSIIFQGDAPSISGCAFNETTATAYYPANNDSWTEEVMHSYGGAITWIPFVTSIHITELDTVYTLLLDQFEQGSVSFTAAVSDTYVISVEYPSNAWPGFSFSEEYDDAFTGSGFRVHLDAGETFEFEIISESESQTACMYSITVTSGTSGNCGDNAAWAFDEATGTLTISGTGEMNSYVSSDVPWASIDQEIVSVEIEDGITSIGDYAFYWCGSLASVNIPDSVTYIGDGAFYGCYSLPNLTIPDNVAYIGDSAFTNCTGLTNIHVPANVTYIGDGAFSRCSSLTEVSVDENNQHYSSDANGALYDKAVTTLIQVPATISGEYKIPNSVTHISNYAFAGCSSLSDISISGNVATIGNYAFNGCTGLVSIVLPDSVTSIGNFAFYGCSSLTNLTIPSSVTHIGHHAFTHCTGLSEIIFAGNAPEGINLFADYIWSPAVTATAYYPAGNDTWTEEIMQQYGGNITWVAVQTIPTLELGENTLAAAVGKYVTASLTVENGGEYVLYFENNGWSTEEIRTSSGNIPRQKIEIRDGYRVITVELEADVLYKIGFGNGSDVDGTLTVTLQEDDEVTAITCVHEALTGVVGGDSGIGVTLQPFTAGWDTLTWESSDTAVFTVAPETDHTATVTYVGAGEATLTVRVSNGVELQIPVSVTYPDGWVQKDGTWYYYQDGNPVTGWLKDGNYWYYLDSTGTMTTGWVKVGNNWFYMNKSGVMQTGWQKINGYWYYFASGGAMQTGWVSIGGKWYYFASGGTMQTGWVSVGGKWYYMASSGAMQTGWITVNGSRYYLDSKGVMQTGWIQLDGTWYYLTSSGKMATGWTFDGSYWYYMDENGIMQTGWITVNGKWYYLNKSGVMQTGWLKDGNYWYYLDATGAMVTGTQVINGKTYVFNKSGVWIG